jgi:hypothetical protein
MGPMPTMRRGSCTLRAGWFKFAHMKRKSSNRLRLLQIHCGNLKPEFLGNENCMRHASALPAAAQTTVSISAEDCTAHQNSLPECVAVNDRMI